MRCEFRDVCVESVVRSLEGHSLVFSYSFSSVSSNCNSTSDQMGMPIIIILDAKVFGFIGRIKMNAGFIYC